MLIFDRPRRMRREFQIISFPTHFFVPNMDPEKRKAPNNPGQKSSLVSRIYWNQSLMSKSDTFHAIWFYMYPAEPRDSGSKRSKRDRVERKADSDDDEDVK